ncbi:unnamed protein product [Soboliphyme baturini]|uniref:Syntaxin-6_N domain-containing protein n=1 Tax=Soboliphyme baturini TaxID=241478 RepID=A0A183J6I4_9BILA|nr:unnamed protein product [Soboliphyme baturini]
MWSQVTGVLPYPASARGASRSLDPSYETRVLDDKARVVIFSRRAQNVYKDVLDNLMNAMADVSQRLDRLDRREMTQPGERVNKRRNEMEMIQLRKTKTEARAKRFRCDKGSLHGIVR